MDSIMLVLAISGITSALFSYLIVTLKTYQRDFRLTEVESKVESLLKAHYQSLGAAGRDEKKQRRAAFLANAAAVMKGEGEPKDKLMKAISSDPEIAMEMAKKLGISL